MSKRTCDNIFVNTFRFYGWVFTISRLIIAGCLGAALGYTIADSTDKSASPGLGTGLGASLTILLAYCIMVISLAKTDPDVIADALNSEDNQSESSHDEESDLGESTLFSNRINIPYDSKEELETSIAELITAIKESTSTTEWKQIESKAELKGLCCPISGKIMQDPVKLSDNYIYDRSSANQLLTSKTPRSKITKKALNKNELSESKPVKKIIHSFLSKKLKKLQSQENNNPSSIP